MGSDKHALPHPLALRHVPFPFFCASLFVVIFRLSRACTSAVCLPGRFKAECALEAIRGTSGHAYMLKEEGDFVLCC